MERWRQQRRLCLEGRLVSVVDLDTDAPAPLSAFVTMPLVLGGHETALQVVAGGPIDPALINCSVMEASSRSMAEELIHQLVDVRGARWVQLNEPTAEWCNVIRAELQSRGTDGPLSVVPRKQSSHTLDITAGPGLLQSEC